MTYLQTSTFLIYILLNLLPYIFNVYFGTPKEIYARTTRRYSIKK